MVNHGNKKLTCYMPESYLDSLTAECYFIEDGHFSTFGISKIAPQFHMRQSISNNGFNVCKELSFSRTLRQKELY